MEQESDYKLQLTSIINDPDSLKLSDIPLLKELVDLYPYFQPLRLILAKLSMETEAAEHTLTTTALFTNGTVLHQFLHRKSPNGAATFVETEKTAIKELPEIEAVLSKESTMSAGADESEDILVFEDSGEHEQAEEIETVEEVNDTLLDDQETFEEINEVDAHDYIKAVDETHRVTPAPVIETLEDNFVENIAATDFFAFQKNFTSEISLEEDLLPEQSPEQSMALSTTALQDRFQAEKDTSEITNYDDDTLPYTFLWWLAKTRKAHSTIFQPYAAPKKEHPNELQQQYVEHIFHIQSPFNAEEILNNVPERSNDPKDGMIIDAFLKKDPQISAPRPEQIDNENKAKKSAEDHNDLVSETLAKIYIEQMLYHKAIDTYEKLSLKFPEKSRYFADLIQSIKKKI